MTGRLAPIFSRPVVQQFLSFAGVGLVAVGVHYSIMIAMIEVGRWPTLTSTTTGFFSGGLVSYALNQWLTFDARPALLTGLAKFMAFISIGAVINALLVAFLTRAGAYYLLAQAIATGVVLFWNFFSARFFVFQPRLAKLEEYQS